MRAYAKSATAIAQQNASKLSVLVTNKVRFCTRKRFLNDRHFQTPLGEIAREQKEFEATRNSRPSTAATSGDTPLPWSGASNEEAIKQKFFEISKRPENFLEQPPLIDGDETIGDYGSIAAAMLELDAELGARRYELVPKRFVRVARDKALAILRCCTRARLQNKRGLFLAQLFISFCAAQEGARIGPQASARAVDIASAGARCRRVSAAAAAANCSR